MAKVDKKFDYLGLIDRAVYNHLDKATNVRNNVVYMLDRSNVMFKYHNLPDSIPASEIEKILQTSCFAVVGKINGELYALNAGLGGETDVYSRPTQAVVSVPYLNYNATWEIGKDCIVIKNDTAALGLVPMFAKYCTLMNETEISMRLATINERIAFLMSASDDNTIDSAKKFLVDIEAGKQGVISDSKVFESFKANPLSKGNNSGITDLIELEQYLKGSMFNEIGLNANYNMKRERLSESEVEMNGDNLYPLVDDMLSNRRSAIERINAMFETDIQVEFNSSWDYRIYQGESIHNTGEEISTEEINTETEEAPETVEDTSTEEVAEQAVEAEPEQEKGEEDEPANS